MSQRKTYHVTSGTDGGWKVKEEKASNEGGDGRASKGAGEEPGARAGRYPQAARNVANRAHLRQGPVSAEGLNSGWLSVFGPCQCAPEPERNLRQADESTCGIRIGQSNWEIEFDTASGPPGAACSLITR